MNEIKETNELVNFLKIALICGISYYIVGPVGLAIIALVFLMRKDKDK